MSMLLSFELIIIIEPNGAIFLDKPMRGVNNVIHIQCKK